MQVHNTFHFSRENIHLLLIYCRKFGNTKLYNPTASFRIAQSQLKEERSRQRCFHKDLHGRGKIQTRLQNS